MTPTQTPTCCDMSFFLSDISQFFMLLNCWCRQHQEWKRHKKKYIIKNIFHSIKRLVLWGCRFKSWSRTTDKTSFIIVNVQVDMQNEYMRHEYMVGVYGGFVLLVLSDHVCCAPSTIVDEHTMLITTCRHGIEPWTNLLRILSSTTKLYIWFIERVYFFIKSTLTHD